MDILASNLKITNSLELGIGTPALNKVWTSTGAAGVGTWRALTEIDGAGSGLDADLLDGQNSSYFLNTSSTAQAKTSQLELVATSGSQLRLSYTTGSVYTDFQTTSAGSLQVTPSGGYTYIGGLSSAAVDRLQMQGAGTFSGIQNLLYAYGQASTVYSETGTTGAEEAIATNGYVAIKITTNSTFLQLGELKVFLRKTADVNAMAMIRAFIYTDVAGVPGVSVNTGTFNLYAGALTTSLAQYSIALEQNTLSASTSYWIVLQVLGQTTGTIYLGYKNAAGSASFATSSNGSSWTTSNFFPNFLITNRGYRGSYLRGQAREGAYIFSDRYYGATIASNGGWAISAFGLMGGAVIGSSSSYGNGVYIYATNGYAAAFRQTGALVDDTTQQCVTIIRNNTLGSFTSTGDLLFVQDTSGSTGNLFNVLQGATSRVVITSAGYLRVADGAVSTPEVSFINESSTGLYRAGSGQLGVSVSGTLRSRFLATGLELYNQSGPQLRLSGLSTNTGGTYLACVDEGDPSNEGYLSFGAEGTHSGGGVSTWVARVASAGIMHCDNGTFTFYSNTSGLTVGSTFTPTTALTVSSGAVAVGTNVPLTVAGGLLTAQGAVTINSIDPRLYFYETDGATDQKRNDFINQSSVFVGRFYNDAGSLSHTWLTVTRTSGTYTADTITLASTFFSVSGTVSSKLNFAQGSGSSAVIGLKITGNTNDKISITAGGTINFGSGSAGEDTNLYRVGANNLGTDDSFYVAGSLGVGTSSPTYALDVAKSAAGAFSMLRLYNTQTATANNGSELLFDSNRTTNGATTVASIRGLITDINATTYKGALVFCTSDGASQSERMRINHKGHIILPEISADPTTSDLTAAGNYNSNNVAIYTKGNKFVIAYYDGIANIRYLTIDLDGTDTTWSHSTTVP